MCVYENVEERNIIEVTLGEFKDANLESEAARKAIACRIEKNLRNYWKDVVKRGVVNSKIKLDVN